MSDGSISFAKLGPIVVQKSLKASAMSSAEFTISLISEIFRILPHLREVSSSISIHVLRGFFLFIYKLCINYCQTLFIANLVYYNKSHLILVHLETMSKSENSFCFLPISILGANHRVIYLIKNNFGG